MEGGPFAKGQGRGNGIFCRVVLRRGCVGGGGRPSVGGVSRQCRQPHWPSVAEKLAAAFPRERLHPAVVAFVEKSLKTEGGGTRLLQPSGFQAFSLSPRWAVAFSGGADSLALLLLLWAHWPERRGRLLALHFDHRLRGRASAGDERFCRSVCAALGVAYASGAWSAAGGGGGGDGKKCGQQRVSEAQAREARMAFFAGQLSRRRIRCLFLGHQLDDIAETLFMRVARGSGTAGLAAPRPVHHLDNVGVGSGGGGGAAGRGRVHLRPLLTLSKARIVDSLAAAGATWREDASNAEGDFFRNRIRLDVLPRWLEAASGRVPSQARDALAGAALTRAQLEEDADALDEWAGRVARTDADGRLPLTQLAGVPRAVVRRVLHLWLGSLPVASDLSRQGFDSLLDKLMVARSTRFSLGDHGFAVVKRGWLAYQTAASARVVHHKVRSH